MTDRSPLPLLVADDKEPRLRTAAERLKRENAESALQAMESRLEEWRQEVARLAQAPDGVEAFLALTLRNVMGSLTDLVSLSRTLRGNAPAVAQPCQLMNCPRGLQLHAALRETIDVLEETKSAFKSKTLAALRQKLELVLGAQ